MSVYIAVTLGKGSCFFFPKNVISQGLEPVKINIKRGPQAGLFGHSVCLFNLPSLKKIRLYNLTIDNL